MAVAVVDVGAQRVQRHAPLAIPLGARDLGAAEPAAAVDADALRAEPHRRLHGPLHGAAERHAALELLGDRLRDQMRVDLGLAHLDDVDVHLRLRHRGDLLAELLDVGALLADDDARARRVDGDAALLVRALDHDPRHRRLLQVLHQRVADAHVLVQQRRRIRSSLAYQRESQVLLMPRRSPIGLTFCPMLSVLRRFLRLRGPRWSGSRTASGCGRRGRGRAA